jgi:hypothetical protein
MTERRTMTLTPGTEIEPVEAEIVHDDDRRPPALVNLFGSTDPDLVLAEAAKVAAALEKVIRAQKLYVTIRGRDHVRVEGWTLLGTMLGVFPVLAWTRPLADGWEARVEAKTMGGQVVGAAESECLRSETRWRNADDYALRSMAATRATSKALRQPLGFIMPLAHFAETPLEEIPPDEPPPATPDSGGKIPPSIKPDPEQWQLIRELLAELQERAPDEDWPAKARGLTGVPAELMTRTLAAGLIRSLEKFVSVARAAGQDP